MWQWQKISIVEYEEWGNLFLSLLDLIPSISNPGGMNGLNLPKQTFHLLVMDVESFYLGETCFLRVLSGIISVTAISAGICITRLTANLYVPAYFSFLSFRY